MSAVMSTAMRRAIAAKAAIEAHEPTVQRRHCAHDDGRVTLTDWDGPITTWCDMCGREL
jgi:hypothetical protein